MQNSLINVPASCHKIVDRIFLPEHHRKRQIYWRYRSASCWLSTNRFRGDVCPLWRLRNFSIETFSHPKLTNYPRFRLAKYKKPKKCARKAFFWSQINKRIKLIVQTPSMICLFAHFWTRKKLQKFFFRPVTRRLTVACAQLCHKDSAASVGTQVVDAAEMPFYQPAPSAAAKKVCERETKMLGNRQASSITL